MTGFRKAALVYLVGCLISKATAASDQPTILPIEQGWYRISYQNHAYYRDFPVEDCRLVLLPGLLLTAEYRGETVYKIDLTTFVRVRMSLENLALAPSLNTSQFQSARPVAVYPAAAPDQAWLVLEGPHRTWLARYQADRLDRAIAVPAGASSIQSVQEVGKSLLLSVRAPLPTSKKSKPDEFSPGLYFFDLNRSPESDGRAAWSSSWPFPQKMPASLASPTSSGAGITLLQVQSFRAQWLFLTSEQLIAIDPALESAREIPLPAKPGGAMACFSEACWLAAGSRLYRWDGERLTLATEMDLDREVKGLAPAKEGFWLLESSRVAWADQNGQVQQEISLASLLRNQKQLRSPQDAAGRRRAARSAPGAKFQWGGDSRGVLVLTSKTIFYRPLSALPLPLSLTLAEPHADLNGKFKGMNYLKILRMAPESVDLSAQARGQKLAQEACTVVFGPEHTCAFTLKNSKADAIYFETSERSLLTSERILQLFPDDQQLRSLFAWAMQAATVHGPEIAEKSKKARVATAVTLGVTAGIGMMVLENIYVPDLFDNDDDDDNDIGEALGFLSAFGVGCLTFRSADLAIWVAQIPLIFCLNAQTDRATLNKLNSAGYDPIALVAALDQVASIRRRSQQGLQDWTTGVGVFPKARAKLAKLSPAVRHSKTH